MQFDDDVTAGVVLIRPAIQSPDYVPGTSGWAVKIDGSAEFNNVVLRGSTTQDALVIGPDTGSQVRIGYSGTVARVQFPMHSSKERTASSVFGRVTNSGGTGEQLDLVLSGPTVTTFTDRMTLALQSESADGALPARMYVDVNGTKRLLDVTPDSVAVEVPLAVYGSGGQALTLNMNSPASGAKALSVDVSGSSTFAVDDTGTITRYSSWTPFTPVWNNTGGAVFATNVGWWKRVDDIYHWEIYAAATGAGSGTTAVTLSGLPFNPYRAGSGAGTTRQRVGAHVGGVAAGTNSSVSGSFTALCLAGGAASTIDRLTGPTGIDLRGENISSSFIATIQGWMRAA